MRRWQRAQIGELWQLDASPHHWFPHCKIAFPCSICWMIAAASSPVPNFTSANYCWLILISCPAPLALTAGRCNSMSTTTASSLPTRRTRSPNWGATLRFYDISLRYAPTPQAKGKIEREHQFWQGRQPPSFASEKITELAEANQHFDALRHHHNATEIHRELRQTPQRAWTRPRKKNVPSCRPCSLALGGPMSGAYAPASKSAAMPTSPSVPNAFVLNDRRAPRSSSASLPQATIPSWPPARTPSSNPSLCSPTAPNKLVLFC
jgi:hypothetical protein